MVTVMDIRIIFKFGR